MARLPGGFPGHVANSFLEDIAVINRKRFKGDQNVFLILKISRKYLEKYIQKVSGMAYIFGHF